MIMKTRRNLPSPFGLPASLPASSLSRWHPPGIFSSVFSLIPSILHPPPSSRPPPLDPGESKPQIRCLESARRAELSQTLPSIAVLAHVRSVTNRSQSPWRPPLGHFCLLLYPLPPPVLSLPPIYPQSENLSQLTTPFTRL